MNGILFVKNAVPQVARGSRLKSDLERTMLDKLFTCVDCGELFESLAPPAETREDDPHPRCSDCIEMMLDDIDAEPLDDATIERIMAKVLLKRPLE